MMDLHCPFLCSIVFVLPCSDLAPGISSFLSRCQGTWPHSKYLQVKGGAIMGEGSGGAPGALVFS